MKTANVILGALGWALVATTPAVAQDTSNTAQADQTAVQTDQSQPTDKEQKQLDKCKAMTSAQRAQSSKCTDLMKKFGITEAQGDPMNNGLPPG